MWTKTRKALMERTADCVKNRVRYNFEVYTTTKLCHWREMPVFYLYVDNELWFASNPHYFCAEHHYTERARYNKAYYSLDADDGIEYSACLHELTPDEVLELKERFCRLWNALNSLPETQGRRVDAHFILGMTYREIAKAEGVDKSAVRRSVLSGIAQMKKYLRKNP